MMIMGAAPDGGVNLIPRCPANPIPAAIEKIIMISAEKVPETVLVARKIVTMIARNIKGMRLPESLAEASKKALLSIIIPERCVFS